jgi:hypothetical protein
VVHQSGHLGAINSKALELLGVTAATADPNGGVYRRRPGSREPDGVLEEAANSAAYGKLIGQFDSDTYLCILSSGTRSRVPLEPVRSMRRRLITCPEWQLYWQRTLQVTVLLSHHQRPEHEVVKQNLPHRVCIAARANVQYPRAQPTTLEASGSGKTDLPVCYSIT